MTVTNDFRRWWDGLDMVDKGMVKIWVKGFEPEICREYGESVATKYAEELYRENPGNQSLDDSLPDLMERIREMVLEVTK